MKHVSIGSFVRTLLLPSAMLCCACVGAQDGDSVNQLTDAEQRSGWQLLFDGKSFDGWRNYKKEGISDGWKIDDGAMVRQGKGAGDIITQEQYKWFELVLDYNISPQGNSGVMFHVTEDNNTPWQSGPEIQVQDNVDGHDPQKSGWLYQLYKPVAPAWAKQDDAIDATRPAGQWNQLYVRIASTGCEVVMNGNRYYAFKLGSKDWDDRVAKSKFAAFKGFGKAGQGHICLQDHGNLVSYRNVKVRKLDENGEAKQPIDGKLPYEGTLAFPNLKWERWQAVNDEGKLRPLRILDVVPTSKDSDLLMAISQQGAVWTIENKPETAEAKMFFDHRDHVKDWTDRGANEEGLLGIAPHPKYEDNGYVYLYYTHRTERKSIVSRITRSADDPRRADPDSEVVLMEIDQPFQNHNGGSIEFGPDGYLYIGLGDGGDRNDPHAAGQDLSKWLGKILRIDVDSSDAQSKYGIPADNPFVNRKDARAEIYAFGIRNPWRLAFDHQTGDLWCGDVGQELWEEVDLIKKGGNYGWSVMEGSHPFGKAQAAEDVSKPIAPVWEYDHRIGRSITGGRVYRGTRLPELNGKYLYADYVTGRVWALEYDRQQGRAVKNLEIFGGDVPVLGFGHDTQGEVYYLTESARGECIYRLQKK